MGRTAGWVVAIGVLTGGVVAASEQGWFMPERMSALMKLSAQSAAPADWSPVPEKVAAWTPEPRAAVPAHRQKANPAKEANATRFAPVPAAPIQAVIPRPSEIERLPFAKPRDEAARRKLVQSIQTELRRVGCYGSDSDGAWTEGTRRAMKAFTDRINATLPVDEPDYILLTLVQGQRSRACGKDCPLGQIAVAGDRCEPRAIVAQKNERAARLQQEAQIRRAKAEAEHQARKAAAAPQVAPVAMLPLAPAKAADVPLRAPAAPPSLAVPPLALGVESAEPAPAPAAVPEVPKPMAQIAERARPRPTRPRTIGGFAPASGLGRVNRPPSRAVAVRKTGSGVRSAPFASLARSAP